MDDLPISSDPQPTLLTVGEASDVMLRECCRYTSNRKVQRMCREGDIACEKITTTRDGNPVTEWLVDRASLLKHIEMHEPKWPDGEGLTAERPIRMGLAHYHTTGQFFEPLSGSDTGNVSPSATGDDTATPDGGGGANPVIDHRRRHAFVPNVTPLPHDAGAAAGGADFTRSGVNAGDAAATPGEDGDAIGETRRLADVLIDNAKLTAELEGAKSLIESITDEKAFLREELREARAGRKDVTAIAQRMLETLETIAIGGKLMVPPPSQPDDNVPPEAWRARKPFHEQGSFAPRRRTGDNPPEQERPYQL